MNTYFYAPKEDVHHRLFWREQYSKKWRLNFKKFIQFSNLNNIKVIAGIAPGLDFNFEELKKIRKCNEKTDLQFLLEKSRQLLHDGASSIALMLDDIPNDFKNKFGLIFQREHITPF